MKTRTIKTFINYDYNNISNFLINFLSLRKIKHISSAVHYKNRFLLNKRSSKLQFIGLILNNGYKLRYLKTVNSSYKNFLYYFHSINVLSKYHKIFNSYDFNTDEFTTLYKSFSLFKDWSQVLAWRVEENLPLVKVITKKKKQKKKKKKKKKKKINF